MKKDKKQIGKLSIATAVGLISGSIATGQIQEPKIKEVIKEKPAISEVLQYVDQKERRKVKARIIKDKAKKGLFRKNDTNIEIVRIIDKADEGTICVIARAEKNNKRLKVNNPLCFQNPPVKVPDGTKRIEIDELGMEREVDNFKEDAEEALKEIVLQTIEVQNKD